MKTFLSLLCAFLLLVSQFLVAYFEAVWQFRYPCAVYEPFDVWLPIVLVLFSYVVAVTLPLILAWFTEDGAQ